MEVRVVRACGPARCGHGRNTGGTTPTARRSGVLSLELALILPIVAVLLFALIEFTLLFGTRQALVEGSRAGARVASLAGATLEDVRTAVRDQLGDRYGDALALEVELGERSGDLVAVQLRLPMRCVSPDLLAMIGLSLRGHDLIAETVMSKE